MLLFFVYYVMERNETKKIKGLLLFFFNVDFTMSFLFVCKLRNISNSDSIFKIFSFFLFFFSCKWGFSMRDTEKEN